MQFIQKLFLVILIVTFQVTVSSAILTPVQKGTKTHKLKFKEKAAIWLFKRKLKKIKKNLNISSQAFNYHNRDTTDCTTILLKTGDQLEVKLLKTTENDVIFRRCNKRESEITMSKSDIFQIILSDGLVVFDGKKHEVKSKNSGRTTNYGYTILAILTGLFALLLLPYFQGPAVVLSLLSVILGITSYKRHKKDKRSFSIAIILFSSILFIYSLFNES